MRFECAKNVNKATDKMMQACGGSGYKRDLGKDSQTQVGSCGSTSIMLGLIAQCFLIKIRTLLQVDISSMV